MRKESWKTKLRTLRQDPGALNFRLVNLPERTVEEDTCSFLEKWIPETLGLTTVASKLILERAHWVGQRREPGAPLRTMIMKFETLNNENDRDKVAVLRAVRTKTQILFVDQPVVVHLNVFPSIC